MLRCWLDTQNTYLVGRYLSGLGDTEQASDIYSPKTPQLFYFQIEFKDLHSWFSSFLHKALSFIATFEIPITRLTMGLYTQLPDAIQEVDIIIAGGNIKLVVFCLRRLKLINTIY